MIETSKYGEEGQVMVLMENLLSFVEQAIVLLAQWSKTVYYTTEI